MKNRRKHRPGTAYLAQMLRDQARVLTKLGRYAAAEQALAEDELITRSVHGKLEYNINERIQLALFQVRTDVAARLAASIPPGHITAGPISIELVRDLSTKAEIALQRGDGSAAVSLSRQLLIKLRASQMDGYLNVWRVRALVYAGHGYLFQDDPENAVLLLQQAVSAQAAMLDENCPELAATEALLGTACFKAGDRRKAIKLLVNARSRLRSHRELSDMYRAPVAELVHSITLLR